MRSPSSFSRCCWQLSRCLYYISCGLCGASSADHGAAEYTEPLLQEPSSCPSPPAQALFREVTASAQQHTAALEHERGLPKSSTGSSADTGTSCSGKLATAMFNGSKSAIEQLEQDSSTTTKPPSTQQPSPSTNPVPSGSNHKQLGTVQSSKQKDCSADKPTGQAEAATAEPPHQAEAQLQLQEDTRPSEGLQSQFIHTHVQEFKADKGAHQVALKEEDVKFITTQDSEPVQKQLVGDPGAAQLSTKQTTSETAPFEERSQATAVQTSISGGAQYEVPTAPATISHGIQACEEAANKMEKDGAPQQGHASTAEPQDTKTAEAQDRALGKPDDYGNAPEDLSCPAQTVEQPSTAPDCGSNSGTDDDRPAVLSGSGDTAPHTTAHHQPPSKDAGRQLNTSPVPHEPEDSHNNGVSPSVSVTGNDAQHDIRPEGPDQSVIQVASKQNGVHDSSVADPSRSSALVDGDADTANGGSDLFVTGGSNGVGAGPISGGDDTQIGQGSKLSAEHDTGNGVAPRFVVTEASIGAAGPNVVSDDDVDAPANDDISLAQHANSKRSAEATAGQKRKKSKSGKKQKKGK